LPNVKGDAALLKDSGAAANPANVADAIRFATSALLKSGKPPAIDRVLSLLLADTTPAWGRTEILAGVKHFLPKGSGSSGGGRGGRGGGERLFSTVLSAEPKPLVAFAAKATGAEATAANEVLRYLKWPGKPGAEATGARPLTADEQKLFELGKTQFATLCAACHQPQGQGLAGHAPSFVYSRWMVGDPRVLARIVLNGKVQENMTMPP
jgi:mono/diheme cytochrome c family protein